jgi:hypothetical protein
VENYVDKIKKSLLLYFQNIVELQRNSRKKPIGLVLAFHVFLSTLDFDSRPNSCDKHIQLSGLLILNRTSYDEQEFYPGARLN